MYKKDAVVPCLNIRETLLLLCLVLATTANVAAQPSLSFKRLVNNWPTIELYFSVACNGDPARFTDKQYFRVQENGLDIPHFALSCPDNQPGSFSMSLVFDASNSMAGPSNTFAKAAGNTFVNGMDSTIVEAAMIWFNGMVVISQPMTNALTLLHTAIDGLPAATGSTALWDAAYTGVLHVQQNGKYDNKAVVVLTDGGDNASHRTTAEVIALANANWTRVFTIALGYPLSESIAQMQELASKTDGQYFWSKNGSDLVAIYQQILALVSQPYITCKILYDTNCPDGHTRVVDLTVKDFCNGSDTKSKSYTAPLDVRAFVPVRIGLGDVMDKATSSITVPLLLLDTIWNNAFPSARFAVMFDGANVDFQSITAPSGSLLEGTTIQATRIPNGVLIVTGSKAFNGFQPPTTIAELVFHARPSGGADTTQYSLTLQQWMFDFGCLTIVPGAGSLTVFANRPRISCASIVTTDSVRWNPSMSRYDPDPIKLRAEVANTGTAIARNTRFRIRVSPSQCTLVSAGDSVLSGSPVDIDPGGKTSAEWELQMKSRTSNGVVDFTIEAWCDDQPSSICTRQIWVEKAGARVSCDLAFPKIRYDTTAAIHVPMPFDVPVMVTNSGGERTDTVFATIQLPQELRLSGPDAPDGFTKRVLPPLLNPGQQTGLAWTLTHASSCSEKKYTVRVVLKTSNANSSFCDGELIIPALPCGVMEASCQLPDSLALDSNIGSYLPDPFDVTVFCKNIGWSTINEMSATLRLPGYFMLADTADPWTKRFVPKDISPYHAGDSIPQLTWKVRCRTPFNVPMLAPVAFDLFGTNSVPNIPLDTVHSFCTIYVPAALNAFDCLTFPQNPDSVLQDAAGTGLYPEPIVWNAGLVNSGSFTTIFKKAEIFTSAGLSVDASTPAMLVFTRTVRPSDSLFLTWTLHPRYQLQNRVDTITVEFTDDNGQKHSCTTVLPVRSVHASLSCLLASAEHFLFYNENTRRYVPDTWTVTGTLRNDGKIPLTNIQATIGWNDPNGVRLAEFNPAFPGNSNPKTAAGLVSGQQAQFTWGFRVAAPNLRNDTAMVGFSISYNSTEVPLISSGCTDSVGVGPAGTTGIEDIPGVAGFELDQNYPNPFSGLTTIRFRISDFGLWISDLPFRATDVSQKQYVLKVFDAYGREVRSIPLVHAAPGEYSVTFDAAGLPSGLYEYRVIAPGSAASRRMMVVK